MALVQAQITLINALVADNTITEAQAIDLLSSAYAFSDAQITFIQSLGLTSAQEEILLATDNLNQQTLEQEIAEAKKYLRAGDIYNTRLWLVQAEMTVAGLPDHQIGNRRIQYREQIRFISDAVDKIEGKSPNSAKNKRISGRYVR